MIGYAKFLNTDYGDVYYRGEVHLHNSVLPSISRKPNSYKYEETLNRAIKAALGDERFAKTAKLNTIKNSTNAAFIMGAMLQHYGYKSLLWELKVRQSFSKRGTPYDNSAVEGFFSNMKQDDLNTRRFEFFHELVLAVNEYIEHYNNYRPHQRLKYKTPNQVEEEYVPETFDDEEDPF